MNKLVIRNIALSVALVILLAIILFSSDRSPFGSSESSFESKPVKGITRIEMTQGSEKLVLALKGEEWIVNDGKTARESAIIFITRILEEIRIKSTVSDEMFSQEVTEKNIEPVRVKVFEGRRVLSSFLVYKTGTGIYGNIMKLSAKAKPFINYLPGYEGDIGSVFILNELFWQPFTIFDFLPSRIESVAIDDRTSEGSSFRITAEGNNYSISDNKGTLTGWDTSKVKRYLSYFTFIPFENWAFDLTEDKTSAIVSDPPAYIITVVGTEGRKVALSLWYRYNENGAKDSDRLWGKTDESDKVFIIRYFDIDPVLRKKAYFFPE